MLNRLPRARRARRGNRGHRDDLAAAGAARPMGCQGAHVEPPGPRAGPRPGGRREGHGRTHRPHQAPRAPRGQPYARLTPRVRGPHRAGQRLVPRGHHRRPRPPARPRLPGPRPRRRRQLRLGARRSPHQGDPLALVCTNGKRDRCCALLGRPLAAELASSGVEGVWEVTHLGGHRFSPPCSCCPTATRTAGRRRTPSRRCCTAPARAGSSPGMPGRFRVGAARSGGRAGRAACRA